MAQRSMSCAGKAAYCRQVDIMLAAFARQHKLTILTTDADFDALPDIRCQNWVV